MIQRILILALILISPVLGNWLAKICKEELKDGKRWFTKGILWIMILNIFIISLLPLLKTKTYYIAPLSAIVLLFLGFKINTKNKTNTYIITILNAISIPISLYILPIISIIQIILTALTFFILSALKYDNKILQINKETKKQLIYFSCFYLFFSILSWILVGSFPLKP